MSSRTVPPSMILSTGQRSRATRGAPPRPRDTLRRWQEFRHGCRGRSPRRGHPLQWDRRGIGRMFCGCGRQQGSTRLPPGFARPGRDASDPLLDRAASRVPANPVDVRRDEPVAASLGRSTVQRRRRFCVVPFWNLTQSSGRRARPPSSGRSTRQRRNVKRSRRAPGATRRVLGRSPTSARHPEHGEAG
jgi:hypothetical protein